MTAANILTLSRLVIVPFFVASFAIGHNSLALILFCVAGFTDLIDGSVARWLKQPSKGGALLDPLADKLLIESCFISLAVCGLLPWWFVALALSRDAAIICGIFWLERIKAELPYRPTYASKFATLIQLAVAVMGLIRWWKPFAFAYIEQWHMGAIVIAAILIAISGVQYVIMGIEILRATRRAPRATDSK